MTAIVSFYLIAILAQRVRSHSLQERNMFMALNPILVKNKTEMQFALLVLRTRNENCNACLQYS